MEIRGYEADGTCSSECSSDSEECVDIIGTESGDDVLPITVRCSSPGIESDRSRTEEDTGHNNFSIDRILGIKKKKNDEIHEKDERIQPIIPRASKRHIIFGLGYCDH